MIVAVDAPLQPGKVTRDTGLKHLLWWETGRDLPGRDLPDQHCVNSRSRGWKVMDV